MRWYGRVAVNRWEDWIVLASKLVVTMGVGAFDPERAKAITIEIATLYGFVVGVGDAIVAFTESFPGHGVIGATQLVRAMRV